MGECHSGNRAEGIAMNRPSISIITVNYRQIEVTCDLLRSIEKLTYPSFEVIVVDNGALSDATQIFESYLPKVKVITTEENLGFAGANNMGIRNATGEFIFLVNNDTILANGLLESLISRFKDEKVGAVSPILRYYDAPEKIQFAGFTKVNPFSGRNKTLTVPRDTRPYSTPYFHGAAVMLRNEAIKQCGLMPEKYFLYYEELSWSKMFKENSYQIFVDPAVYVLHKESVTTGKKSPLKLYYQTRNRIHFMRMGNYAKWLIFTLFFLSFALPKSILKHLTKVEWQHLKALFLGLQDGLIFHKYGFRKF